MHTVVSTSINREGLADYFSSFVHRWGGICVCEERKFIYMKPAKTAGTSILRHVLEPNVVGIIHEKNHPDAFQTWLNRVTDQELESYFIFSVVRNPWDRLVSITSYFQISPQDFIRDFSVYQETPIIRLHSLPQAIYTHRQGQPFVNQICRFETLQADFNLVCDRIGLERQQLPVVNRSLHAHYSRYFTLEGRERVHEIYQEDIAYFGYMFEQLPPLREKARVWLMDRKRHLAKRLKKRGKRHESIEGR